MRRLLLLLLLLSWSAAWADPVPLGGADPVVIGSKKMPESEILAEIASVLLQEKAGLQVERRTGLGGTVICFDALNSGNLDLYPEYTGSGLQILKEPPVGGAAVTWQRVHDEFEQRWHLVWLKPLGFNNTYALAMPEARAAALHIVTISDLAKHQAELRFGSSNEFLSRQDGWIGLAKAYGFTNTASINGMEHGLMYEAVREGKLDVIDVYSTDGEVAANRLRVLQDDKHFFPPYDACFVVRQAALDAHPNLQSTLELLSGQIDDDTMRQMNDAVQDQGKQIHSVALHFLVDKRLIVSRPIDDAGRGTLWDLMLSRETLHLLGQHVGLTAASVALACLVGIPIGLLIARFRRTAGGVLGVLGVLQTVPSIALLAFMIPLLGLGVRPTIAALFLYALLPIVQNAYTGIVTLDPNLVEAARGLGLSDWQITRLIELPLAVPMLMAGLRTSAVICIGTATLAAFIGAGGLGEPIVTGLSLDNTNLILSGAVPAALLAVVVDQGLAGLKEPSRLADSNGNKIDTLATMAYTHGAGRVPTVAPVEPVCGTLPSQSSVAGLCDRAVTARPSLTWKGASLDNALHQSQENWLERVAHHLPGFNGYLDREQRRDADKRQRDFVADALVRSKTRLQDVNAVLVRSKALSLVTQVDHLCNVIDRIEQRIRHASYGYSGFFDAVRIDAAALDRIYQHDAQLLDAVKHVDEGVTALAAQAAGLDIASLLQGLDTSLQNVEQTVDARHNVMMGVA